MNRAVRRLLEETVAPIWVGGEVTGWTRARSGHCYFCLKDEEAQIRAVLFRSEAERLPTDPGEGMQVQVQGSLTLYEARGEYQLVVRRLTTDGADGLWRLALERLRAKLEAEGLLDPARKRLLPRLPARVGIVTSLEGAALRDILQGLRTRAPWARIVVRGTRVQGDGAAAEIARAVRVLGTSGRVDVLIVGRGGGSMEDLWAFNEEVVARAIADCPVPVVSAVGHETDLTIADLVADLRAPTPTAAAEMVVPGAAALTALLDGLGPRLGRALRRRAVQERLRLDRASAAARRALDRRVLGERERLAGLAGRLHALSPLATLSRGYSVATAPDGALLRSVAAFDEGERFDLRVADGTVQARTLAVRRSGPDTRDA
ncbi:MAG: exodeoxyribonuclease VII large subunit [Gemmatimonadota bacterium]